MSTTMKSHRVSRCNALQLEAGAAVLPLVHIRIAGAAGQLNGGSSKRRDGVYIDSFEACSTHLRYGPLIRSAIQGDLCHAASTNPVAQPRH